MHDTNSSDELLQKEQCPKCRENGHDASGDNLARYADGHAHCFRCEYHEHGEGGTVQTSAKKKSSSFIEGSYQGLTNRRITEETCKKFKVTVGKYKNNTALIFPYYSEGRDQVAQKLKTAKLKGLWVGEKKRCTLFGQNLWNKGKKIVVTEGELDAMSVSQINHNKWPVVSITSGAAGAAKDLSNNLRWLEDNFDEIILMFDNV